MFNKIAVGIVLVLALVAGAQAEKEMPKGKDAAPVCVQPVGKDAADVLELARRGCCSWHGGVCGCSNGRAVCCDGSLSPSCGCVKEDVSMRDNM